MKIYLNPCFPRYSLEKSNNNMSSNGPHYESGSSQDSSSQDENKKLTKDEMLSLDENFRAEDRLTIEYRNGERDRTSNEKKKRRYLVVGVVCFLLLIVLAGAIAYLAIHFVSRNNTQKDCKKCDESTSGQTTAGYKKDNETIIKNSDICRTKKCYETAESLKKAMNFTADPCDNFHEYACGIWPKTHPLPPSMSKLDTMSLLNLNKNTYLKDMIEKETNDDKEDGFKSKILEFYNSCMNLEKIQTRGAQPLIDFIARFGGWSPLKSSENKMNDNDITTLLIESHKFFTSSVYDDRVKAPIFKALVKVNDVNSKEHIFEIRERYKLLQTNYVALLGPADNAKEKLKEIIDFEIKLANISNAATYSRSGMFGYNLTSIKHLQDYLGNQIDWLRFVKETFAPLGIEITEETKVGVRFLAYIKQIHDLIASSKTQVVKDYIIWVCVWKFGSYASAAFREADFNFEKSLSGVQVTPKRWKKCITDIEETMEFGLASLYVQKALSDEDRNLATEIVINITGEFKRTLVNVDWMDVTTKAAAFDKASSIKFNIGYPDFVKNHTFLDIMYSKVKVDENKYFETSLNIYSSKRNSNLELLTKPVDKTAYDLPPTLVEAYFDPNKNKMVFLAGILHSPFYDTRAPMALNYGALGLVVGHEITHAFDDYGRSFDGNGERKNWWTESSSKNFKQRTDCIVQQYSNYTLYGINVDGRYTLGENLADNGGIKVAYAAYKEWERTHGTHKYLPGINLTMDQLFFVSMGQVWCGSYREEYAKNALNIDYHSPAKYRIIGPLSNLDAFSKAFKCKKGTTMNPHKKCRVW